MKKILTLILFSFIINFSALCETNYVYAVQEDGSSVKVYLNKYTTERGLVLFDSDSTNTYTKTFKGFEALGDLDYISCYTLPYLETYDFFADVKSCKSIYIAYGKYFDFNILKNVKNLEELDFTGYVSDEDFEEIKKNGIDVSELKYLKKFTFYALGKDMKFDLKIKYAEDASEEK